MDPNETLRAIRIYLRAILNPAGATDEQIVDSAIPLAEHVQALDGWLSGGGTPPEAWREGPDAVGTETGPDAVGDERALPCRECGAMYGHNYPCDSVPEDPFTAGEPVQAEPYASDDAWERDNG